MENNRSIPCVISLLQRNLSKERRDLIFWRNHLSSSDPYVLRQANGNISPTESRIQQLEEALTRLRG
jgi:hypothetical protein